MRYRDRQGNEYSLDTSQDKFLRRLYGTVPGRVLLGILIRPWVTDLIGRYMNSGLSRLKIRRFIRKNGIDMSEYRDEKYACYNDFFIRHIKEGKRPADPDRRVLIAPCDGKVTAYRISPNMVMHIKGSDYSIKSLLLNSELAEYYAGGSCYILRLTVDNYHRYSYAVSGHKSENVHIDGIFHTVNPVAMEHANVYYENSREYTLIDAPELGLVMQMEVGALGVGRIVNRDEECDCTRGDEKGYFEFGGSTVVLMLRKGAVEIDPDLLTNTEDGCETTVRLGEHIGRLCADN